MPFVLIRHQITDLGLLTLALRGDQATRRAYGEIQYTVFQNAANPEDVMIVLEWDDPQRAWLYAQSDDARRMLAQAGLVDPIQLSVPGITA